ncbi:hypothetical protein H6P81_002571 [Aristolochia fimbriata]|uniref:Growth-regulating factor n=1 Tax=Aristolochia fimbriata TaxID=158543 RepID=A0AAV7FAD3_ARIFI|nr:hypothetical protein H6P81_002571 [Aristolochia fimbriata]
MAEVAASAGLCIALRSISRPKMIPARNNKSPFTATQWKELEHQALIFKYMMSGVPIPSDLLYPIRRSFDPITSRLFPHQPMGWGCVGFGRKADPEPGRCRRTDGKKWRCSKEAFPDSKYCERHMHRGKNRSRKPVEIPVASSTITPSKPPATSSPHQPSSLFPSSPASSTLAAPQSRYHPYNASSLHPFLYPAHASSPRPPEIGFPPLTHFSLDSGAAAYSTTEKDYRSYSNGGRENEVVDEQPFFSEASVTGEEVRLRGGGPDSVLVKVWAIPIRTGSVRSSKCFISLWGCRKKSPRCDSPRAWKPGRIKASGSRKLRKKVGSGQAYRTVLFLYISSAAAAAGQSCSSVQRAECAEGRVCRGQSVQRGRVQASAAAFFSEV